MATVNKCAVCDKESASRCSRCKTRAYCSPTCQNRDWPAHKQTCRASKPSVVLLQLASESWYAEMYQDFLRLLRAKANVIVAETAQQARDALAAQPAPRAVILADGGIMDDEHVAFRPRLAAYVRAGGRAVVAGQFGNMDTNKLNAFFRNVLELPWTVGSYQRTDFALARTSPLAAVRGLEPVFSMKAVHIRGVAPADVLYAPADGARVQSHVFAPTPVDARSGVGAACASVGAGLVGYMGDVNTETGGFKAVLAMCGLDLAGLE